MPTVRANLARLAAVAVAAAALSGCASDRPAEVDAPTDPAGAPAAPDAPPQAQPEASGSVFVDGADQHISGPVGCETLDGVATIRVSTRVPLAWVKLSSLADPAVLEVMVHAEDYLLGPKVTGAAVTKDGNTYRVTATAQRLVTSTVQMDQVPVEITATCP